MVDFQKVIQIVKDAAKLFGNEEAAAKITVKGLDDYVTEVDKTVQSTICKALFELYPEIQFMGEEKDNSDIDFGGAVWILDPVDGTTNLIHHFRASSVSLALAEGGQVTAGIVYNPYLEELFFARKGEGAFLNETPIHVSAAPNLASSLVSVGTAPYYHEYADEVFAQMKEIFLHAQDIRRIGSAAIDLAYVACGRTDAFFERILKPWDFAAGMLIIREAGGQVTDYAGEGPSVEGPQSVIASNGKIHEELLGILGKTQR